MTEFLDFVEVSL